MTTPVRNTSEVKLTPEQLIAVVRSFDPGCKTRGRELLMLNPHRADKMRGSFSINLDTERWKDFADTKGKARGSGGLSLLMYAKGINRVKGVKALKAILAGSILPTDERVSGAMSNTLPAWPAAPMDDPGPDFTLLGMGMSGYSLAASWPYRNEQGRTVMHVGRFDQPAREKAIRPYHWNDDAGMWEKGDPSGPLPLYHLDHFAARPDAEVLVCEGEKAVEAAQKLFPDRVCTTSPHGANSAAKADWSALAGRSVTIWPDHDDPGKKYAQEAASLAYAAGATKVSIVQIPADFPQKWDLADNPPKGTNLMALFNAAILVERPKVLTDCVMSLRDFQAMQIKPRDFLVMPWLSSASLNMVYAARGLGKSWFVHHLALCLARGEKFLAWQVQRKCRVLLVDGEMPDATLQKRFRILAGEDIPSGLDILSSEALWLMDQPLNFNDTETQTRFQQMLDARESKGMKPDLIIIDNLSSTTAGIDENDNASLDGLLRWLMGLRHQGYAVLLVHHTGKSGDQRGASRREDLLDTSVKLTTPEMLEEPSKGACFEIGFSKTREERPSPDKLTVVMEVGGKGVGEWRTVAAVSKDVRILQIIYENAPKSQNALADLLGCASTTAGKRLGPLFRDKLIARAGKGFAVTKEGLALLAPPKPRKY